MKEFEVSCWIPNADHMQRMTAAFDMRCPDLPSRSFPTAHLNRLRTKCATLRAGRTRACRQQRGLSRPCARKRARGPHRRGRKGRRARAERRAGRMRYPCDRDRRRAVCDGDVRAVDRETASGHSASDCGERTKCATLRAGRTRACRERRVERPFRARDAGLLQPTQA